MTLSVVLETQYQTLPFFYINSDVSPPSSLGLAASAASGIAAGSCWTGSCAGLAVQSYLLAPQATLRASFYKAFGVTYERRHLPQLK